MAAWRGIASSYRRVCLGGQMSQVRLKTLRLITVRGQSRALRTLYPRRSDSACGAAQGTPLSRKRHSVWVCAWPAIEPTRSAVAASFEKSWIIVVSWMSSFERAADRSASSGRRLACPGLHAFCDCRGYASGEPAADMALRTRPITVARTGPGAFSRLAQVRGGGAGGRIARDAKRSSALLLNTS